MIRLAKNTDAEAIVTIYNHYILNTVVSFEESILSSEDMILRINKVRGVGLPWMVAENDSEIVGYAYAAPWNERCAYRYTVEVSVYIANSAYSQGWGTRLYEALFAELRAANMRIVIAGIALPNPASVALHEKFSMKKVAHFAEIGFKFGHRIDVGYWQGHLDA